MIFCIHSIFFCVWSVNTCISIYVERNVDNKNYRVDLKQIMWFEQTLEVTITDIRDIVWFSFISDVLQRFQSSLWQILWNLNTLIWPTWVKLGNHYFVPYKEDIYRIMNDKHNKKKCTFCLCPPLNSKSNKSENIYRQLRAVTN
jgi:hypothetical protein